MKDFHFAEDFARQRGRQAYPPDAEDAAIDGIDGACECGAAGDQGAKAQGLAGAQILQGADGSSFTAAEKRLMHLLDHWVSSMERLGLADYVRYVDNRKRIFWSNFWGGMARGVGTAVGFTILGAILVLLLQNLAKHNLPLIGDALAQIVSIVQMRLQ